MDIATILSRDKHAVLTTNTTAPVKHHKSPYGYTPTEWICILYVALFGFSTVLHIFQGLYKRPRLYWVLPTIVTCGICETLGWSARLWSSQSPLKIDPFLMQITTTIIAPTFLTAGLYTILGNVIRILGPQYSRLSPKLYLIVFLSADTLALVVQAAGGAKASLAFQAGHNPNPGGHIMLGGIFLQLVGLLVYVASATEFLLRFYFQRPLSFAPIHDSEEAYLDDEKRRPDVIEGRGVMSRNVSLVVLGLVIATLFVLIRTIYRTIELIDGWTGHIITTEKFFNILDGAPITLAMFILNAIHPRLIS